MKKLRHQWMINFTGIFLLLFILAAPRMHLEPAFSLYKEGYCNNEILLILEENVKYEEEMDLFTNAPAKIEKIECVEDFLLLQVEENKIEEVLKYFKESPLIAIAEQNGELTLQSDEFSDLQWAMSEMNIKDTWNYYKNLGLGKKEVIVAILDTGVDYMHPDLIDHMWVNPNEIMKNAMDDDNNGYIDDIYGWDFYNNNATVCHYGVDDLGNLTYDLEDNDNHGTHCAGIIAATANNGIGIAGVASNIDVKIMVLKIHGGKEGKGTIANAIKAIKYATNMGASICNMSWGTKLYSEALEQIMRESTMLFVTAAGNEGINIDNNPLYPASFELDNMITVTFVDANGKLTYESNYGSSVDIAAPGTDIISTTVGSYASMNGSSMAAPHIAGIAAILYSSGDSLYASNIKQIILDNIKPLNKIKNSIANAGIPNMDAITNNLSDLKTDIKPPTLHINMVYDKEVLLLQLEAEDDCSGVRVIKYVTGHKSLEDFKNGTVGISVKSLQVSLSKAGEYTFYISDYAGNASIMYYTVLDDVVAPKIKTSYVATLGRYLYTITATITDEQSGVKSVQYLDGERTINDFRSGTKGKTIVSNDGVNYSFTVDKSGKYTIYSIDYRGNKSISIIDLPQIQVEVFALNQSGKMMMTGSKLYLTAIFIPEGSTDTITFKSSKVSVATVNRHGQVTAISPGLAVITATTNQGLTARCFIFVTYSANLTMYERFGVNVKLRFTHLDLRVAKGDTWELS